MFCETLVLVPYHPLSVDRVSVKSAGIIVPSKPSLFYKHWNRQRETPHICMGNKLSSRHQERVILVNAKGGILLPSHVCNMNSKNVWNLIVKFEDESESAHFGICLLVFNKRVFFTNVKHSLNCMSETVLIYLCLGSVSLALSGPSKRSLLTTRSEKKWVHLILFCFFVKFNLCFYYIFTWENHLKNDGSLLPVYIRSHISQVFPLLLRYQLGRDSWMNVSCS